MNSMREHGFLPEYPVEFTIRDDKKLRLHQGHHRVGVALELGIASVPVRFRFAHLMKKRR